MEQKKVTICENCPLLKTGDEDVGECNAGYEVDLWWVPHNYSYCSTDCKIGTLRSGRRVLHKQEYALASKEDPRPRRRSAGESLIAKMYRSAIREEIERPSMFLSWLKSNAKDISGTTVVIKKK